jgi:hypothetical protein
VQFEDTQGQKKHEIDPEAYIAYLQGRFHFARTDFATAQTFYERALELDTNFADAHARLAQLFINQNIFGLVPIAAVRDQFIHHNRRAVEIDPTHPDGLTEHALAELWFNRDYEKASNELGELYAQFPNNVDLIIACNIALRMSGHETEAARLIDRIVELDPLSPMVYMQRATSALQHRSASDTLADIEQGERLGMSLDWLRADLAIHQNDTDKLADVLRRDAMHWGGAPIARRIVEGQLFLLQGDPFKARQIGEEILTMQSYIPPVVSIQAAAMKGDSDLVTELLDSGLATGDTGLSLNLRSLPLFNIY